MRARPVQSAARETTAAPPTTSRPASSPSDAAKAPLIPPIVPPETEATPPKPKVTGLSEAELKRCETDLPTLETCKPSKSLAEGQSAVIDEVRQCVARYVAALDECLCKAGSKPHCQYAADQQREVGKMRQR